MRPPRRVQLLRLALLAQTVLVAVLWFMVWRGLQGFAWPGGGVETELFQRGLSYLLVLAPTVPVNLLAALWLGRGGPRARLYLACAGVLTAVQQILLLTPVDPGRSTAAGITFAMLIGPVAFAGVALAMTDKSKQWLRAERPRPTPKLVAAESLVWSLGAILAIGTTLSMGGWVQASEQTGPPVGRYDESDAWPRMEDAITTSAMGLDGFPGFESRRVEVTPCHYRTEAGLETYRYWIEYGLADAADHEAYLTSVRDAWTNAEYAILYDGNAYDGDQVLTTRRDDELMMFLTIGDESTLAVQSGCLERVNAHVQCLEAQGGVMPQHDTIEGLACTDQD